MSDGRLAIPIHRSTTVRFLFTVVLTLAAFHGLVLYFIFVMNRDYVMGFVPLFHLDLEGNIPTYFTTLLLIFISYLLFCISRREAASGSKFSRHWNFLSFLFLLLSVDEYAVIHEKTILPLREGFNLDGFFFFSWVVLGIAGTALIGIFYLPMILRLPARLRNGLILAGFVYLGAVLGLELIGGNYASLYGTETFPYQLLVASEELLEMIGLILMINALLEHHHSSQVLVEHTFQV